MKEGHEYISRGITSSTPRGSCLRCGKSEEAHLEEKPQFVYSQMTPEERAKLWLIKNKYNYIRYPFFLTLLTQYIEDPS